METAFLGVAIAPVPFLFLFYTLCSLHPVQKSFIPCKLITRNIFLLTLLNLSKSERALITGNQLTTKDIKKGDRA